MTIFVHFRQNRAMGNFNLLLLLGLTVEFCMIFSKLKALQITNKFNSISILKIPLIRRGMSELLHSANNGGELESINEERRQTVVSNLLAVKERMVESCIRAERNPEDIKLVAVSKTKPSSDILALYNEGHRHFGENYFQELVEKAKALPTDIKWHFIGHLQSSKAMKIIRDVRNLDLLETLDSSKLAAKLNSACESIQREPLKVLIQVDTSGEDTKSGVAVESELLDLVKFVKEECPFLQFTGLMTIGAPGDILCFGRLVAARKIVADSLDAEEHSLQLSMGMSGDFEEAVAQGATSVRVGSTIFGDRIYNKKS